jgi:ferredoxin-thioredoxin reductase catalytic chain
MPAPAKLKTLDDARTFVTTTANFRKWKLTRDEEFLKMLIEGLMTNFNRYGYFLCPCRDGAGVREKDKDLICPCEYCVPDQKQYGHCYCGLYLTPEFYATKKKTRAIPERRPQGSL